MFFFFSALTVCYFSFFLVKLFFIFIKCMLSIWTCDFDSAKKIQYEYWKKTFNQIVLVLLKIEFISDLRIKVFEFSWKHYLFHFNYKIILISTPTMYVILVVAFSTRLLQYIITTKTVLKSLLSTMTFRSTLVHYL